MAQEKFVKFEQIEHSNAFLKQLETEIHQTKTGEISESVARVVLGARKTQLKFAELQLQLARMLKGKQAELPALLSAPK